MSDDSINSLVAPKRIGIWCIVEDPRRGHVTPDLDDEFGISVSALVDELLETGNDAPSIVLWTTKSAREQYESVFGSPDVSVWPTRPDSKRPPAWVRFCLRDALHGEGVGRRPEAWFGPTGRVMTTLHSIGNRLSHALANGPLQVLRWPMLAFWWPLLACLFGVTMLAFAASQWVCHPYREFCRHLTERARRHLAADPVSYPPPEPEIAAPPAMGAVDLWIAPSPPCTLPVSFPFVLVVRDGSFYAAVDRFEPGYALTMDRHLREKCPQALLIVSPKRGVLDDLTRDPLGLPARKMRVSAPLSPRSSEGRGAGGEGGRTREDHGAAARESLAGKRYLVCPVALGPEKNVETLIQAFSLLRKQPGHRDLHLVLIGPGEPLDRHPTLLANVILHRLTPFVHPLGELSPADCMAVLQSAQAAVFPALAASSADAIGSALDAGCPVACSSIPGHRRIVDKLGDACVSFPPHDPRVMADAIQTLLANLGTIRARQLERWTPDVDKGDPAVAWRDLLNEADLIRRHGPRQLYPVADDAPYRLSLVLQQPIPGGTWESAREIVEGLAVVNRRRRAFDLQFVHHPDQPNVEKLQIEGTGLACVPRVLCPLPTNELRRLLPNESNDESLAFFNELDREALLDQDALFFLTFGFPAKLAPVRPYGVMALDMVLFQLPEAFPESVRAMCRDAIRPTLEAAELLVTTSEATRSLLREYCSIDERRALLTPLGCETYRRLAAALPIAVVGLERPFLLNITNFSPHKGAATVVDAFAELKRRLGDECPTLVFAGCNTDSFVSSSPPPSEYVANVRRRIAEAGLVPGRDIVCLGLISEEQAAWLYRNCRAVLNAALADNGTYCLIEGRYFGRPAITSDYPAARWLCERFGLPAHYFPVGDAIGLCDEMQAALGDDILVGDDLARERRRLEADEFSRERFVERLYEHLLTLAKTGRQQRLHASLKLSQTQQTAIVRMANLEDAPCS